MKASNLPTDTRCGYPVEIHNEVLDTHKRIYTALSRGQLIENFLWAASRSTGAKCKRELFDCCIYIFPDRIVLRYHCPAWKDQKAAKVAMQAMEDGRAQP